MEQGIIQMLFALLRSAISGIYLTQEEQDKYSSDMLPNLLELSSKHDVVHLVVLGLKQNELISKDDMDFKKHILKAVYRYERIKSEYEKLCDALEEARIPFLPLKGSVIRKYYPEAWMRTSCDIDVLVHEEDSEKAMSILINDLGYTYEEKSSHDLSFFTSTNLHIELHYDLVEDGIANESSEVLSNIWDTVTVREGCSFWCEMPDEMYYFYHIAHMAKHLENGGCGIRPFIDLWILDKMNGADKEKRDKLLYQGKLLKFAEAARKLSRIWFEHEEYDFISKQVEDYILRGGVYGNTENRVVMQQLKRGGRIKYALSKIFLPYDVIKFHYPILQKQRWLTPVMEVRRWCKLIFCGHLKRTVKEIHYNNCVSNDEAVGAKKFLESIGLH